jgi:hypothetical protein
VVEHDARIGALVCAYLERAGYAPQWVRSGAAALDAAGRGIALVAELVSVRSGFCAWLTVSLGSVDALKDVAAVGAAPEPHALAGVRGRDAAHERVRLAGDERLAVGPLERDLRRHALVHRAAAAATTNQLRLVVTTPSARVSS